MTILKWLGGLIAVIVIAVALFLIGMRFHDGPMEIFSGGPFRTGEPADPPGDWSHLKDRQLIEFQTMDPATSRTVWLATHQGRLFLVSGYMNTGYGKIWKQWPHYIENDNRIILRIDGKLYEQRLERITAGEEIVPVLGELARKYFSGGGDGPVIGADAVTGGSTWMYEVIDRE